MKPLPEWKQKGDKEDRRKDKREKMYKETEGR